MDSRQLIDAQFDRAVEIVQGLPKTGPIQTGYEEKLTMYRCVLRAFSMRQHILTFFAACISKVRYVGLPKLPPADECLRLHKATVGNVKSPRPGMFDMLGRAKWCVLAVWKVDCLSRC